MEIWRNIVGHGRQSEVSNLGRVRSHYNGVVRRRCKRSRTRTQCATITLSENGIKRKRSVPVRAAPRAACRVPGHRTC